MKRRLPSLAPNGHVAMSELSLLSGVNRASRLRPPTSEFDPERKSRALADGRAVVEAFFCPGPIPPI